MGRSGRYATEGRFGMMRDTDTDRLGPMQHRHGVERAGNEARVSCTTDS